MLGELIKSWMALLKRQGYGNQRKSFEEAQRSLEAFSCTPHSDTSPSPLTLPLAFLSFYLSLPPTKHFVNQLIPSHKCLLLPPVYGSLIIEFKLQQSGYLSSSRALFFNYNGRKRGSHPHVIRCQSKSYSAISSNPKRCRRHVSSRSQSSKQSTSTASQESCSVVHNLLII